MAGGVILAAALSDAGVFIMLAAVTAVRLSGVVSFRGHVGLLQAGKWHLTVVLLAWLCTRTCIDMMALVDGWIDGPLRIWLRPAGQR